MPSPTGRQVSAVYQYQSAFATFPSSGNWQTLSAYDLSAGETEGFEEDPLLGRGFLNARDPAEPAPALPTGGGALRVPLCLREIGYWLKLAFGAPTTTGSGDLTHVFKSGAVSLPSFAQSRKIQTSDYRRIRGLMVNGLRISARKEGGYPKVDLDTMLRDEALASADPTGTIVAAPTLLRPAAAVPIVRWETAALGACLSADFSYNNGLTPFHPLGGDQYCDGYDPGAPVISASFTNRYQAQTFHAIAAAKTPGLFEIEWAISATRKITFAIPRAKLAKKPMPIGGTGVIDATFDVSAEQTVSEAAVVVTLKNDVAAYAT